MDGEEYTGAALPVNASELWEGCMLALVVHGIMLAEYPFILNEHVWLDGIYQTMDHEGAKAVLVFSEDNIPLAGVFRQFHSQRTGLILSDKYARSHFRKAPQEQQDMVSALLPLFEEPIGEQVLPVVTTGFWWEDKLLSADSFEDWYDHGGEILEVQMQPFDTAMEYYRQYYHMGPRRAGLAERIWKQRVQSPKETIVLTNNDLDIILENGSEYNIPACQEALNGIQILFEV